MRVPLAASLLLLLLQVVSVAAGWYFLPLAPNSAPGSLAARLLSWDGSWYVSIAQNGYQWNAAIAAENYQNVAFFPFQPIIDRGVMSLTGSTAPIVILILPFIFGIASIFAFDRLARALLAPAAARWAVGYFALWPASSFYLMGYPTGLISLCVIFALLAVHEGRHWRAAMWCGFGTAAAPTVVFVSAALALMHMNDWFRAGARLDALPRLFALGLISIAGLIGFVAYQWVFLHDPLAFIGAQVAWGAAPSAPTRILRLVFPPWYVQQLFAASDELARGWQAWGREGLNAQNAKLLVFGIQRLVNCGAFVIALAGLAASLPMLRDERRAASLAGIAVLFGYLWFIVSTDQNLLNLPRLLFPAVAIFLGLGMLAVRLPSLVRATLLVLLAIVSSAEVAFAASRHWVV